MTAAAATYGEAAPAPAAAPAVKPASLPPPGVCRGTCGDCGADDVGLHPRPGSIERRVCATCAGKAHRIRVDRTRDVIRDLRAAAELGRHEEERQLTKELRDLVGADQASQTIRAIEEAIANRGSGGGAQTRGGGRR